MQKQSLAVLKPYPFGEAALAASRKVWLAGLGASVVTRDWVQNEAGRVFRTLVREGTVVESRAIRFVGDQVESSLTRANTTWRRTRRTVEATVKQAATSVVDYAQQVMPKSLPKIEFQKAFAAAKPAPAKRARKTGARNARPAKKAKRARRA
jgi:pyruvate/2-oxoglutarate dehydrogenase complex dihydrolipoamide acyltransferase (E2) component